MKISQIPARAAVALIKIYRKNISPFTPPCCRFTPTCSEYAIEAFRIHGFIRGSFLALWRILRCNPFSRGGYDPVPEKSRRNKLSKWKVF
ncbi:MAG: membrane protein insertion efficiency factor YidD [Clostridia bacterium]|nr:membrane protein insertion efficiency factor YidD [Clostridia bacterium]MBQ6171215.1 membrane protein insertion efficiency factor YidD [Clostridia bacterium]